MKYINDIPVYLASVDGEGEMMVCISLVDDPATESQFLAFKNEEMLTFSIENEEKRIVRGLVMACDQPIIRKTKDGGFYYIVYNAETIRLMAEKYLALNFQNNVDTMHNFELEEGIDMVQFFIKDTENGINPKGFEDYKDGSLFAEFHVLNDEVWNKIKDGTYKGFSLAGNFGIKEEFTAIDTDEQECIELMNKLINRLKK